MSPDSLKCQYNLEMQNILMFMKRANLHIAKRFHFTLCTISRCFRRNLLSVAIQPSRVRAYPADILPSRSSINTTAVPLRFISVGHKGHETTFHSNRINGPCQ